MKVIDKIMKKNKPNSNVDYEMINERIQKRSGVYDVNSSKKPVRENKPINRQQLVEIRKNSNTSQVRELSPAKPNRKKNLPNIFKRND